MSAGTRISPRFKILGALEGILAHAPEKNIDELRRALDEWKNTYPRTVANIPRFLREMIEALSDECDYRSSIDRV